MSLSLSRCQCLLPSRSCFWWNSITVGFYYWSCFFYMLFDYQLIIHVGKCVARYLRSVGNWPWSALFLITKNLVPVSLKKYLVIYKIRTSQPRRICACLMYIEMWYKLWTKTVFWWVCFQCVFQYFFSFFFPFFLITDIFTRVTVQKLYQKQ